MVNTLIFVIALLGFISALVMVFQEKKNPGYCPKFSHIPACYVVAFAFAFILISRVLILGWLQELFFWGGSAIGLLFGIWFSIRNLRGEKVCPVFLTIPLCYVSFLVFVLLVVLKLLM